MAASKEDSEKSSSSSNSNNNIGKWSIALSILVGAGAIVAYVIWQNPDAAAGLGLPDGGSNISIPYSSSFLNINDIFNGTTISLLPFEQLFEGYQNIIGVDDFRKEWTKLQGRISSSTADASDPVVIGRKMVEEGYHAKHPVFLVPGFVTSGLELWSGEDCAKGYFRKKIWGSLETFRSFLSDQDCWKRHLSLDPHTGMDPNDDIRIRNSQGFEAADFWTSAFWVWDRIIRNLAQIGYDGSNMAMVPYDWRMDYKLLEKRDGHFTKFKRTIEAFVESANGTKAVIMGHSMGGPKVFFFLVWVSKSKEEGGGGGGPEWVEKHIHAYVNIAGPMLGLPKAASALLSGEMKDTNMLYPFGNLVESMFGRKKRHELFASWGALWGMAPKGGDSIWGTAADVYCGEGKIQCGTRCVEEGDNNLTPNIPLLTFTDDQVPDYNNSLFAEYGAKDTWSYDDMIEYLSKWKSEDQGTRDIVDAWNDPTVHPLPNSPSLNVYCMYGVGLPTERMFHYLRQNESENDLPFIMNGQMEDDPDQNITAGIKMTNGDGSVPLLSTGYACTELWKKGSSLNPANVRVVTREHQHEGAFQRNDPMRQGPKSGEHCDILGNHLVLEDIIKIVSGDSVETRLVSNIEEIAKKIREHPINRDKNTEDLDGDNTRHDNIVDKVEGEKDEL